MTTTFGRRHMECPVCKLAYKFREKATGDIVDEFPGGTSYGVIVSSYDAILDGHESCQDELKRRSAEWDLKVERERIEEDRRRKELYLADALTLPAERLAEFDFALLDVSGEKATQKLKAWKPKKPGMILSGKPGVGKTHLLRTFAVHVHLGLDQQIEWHNVNRWLDAIRANDNFEKAERILKRMERVDVLFLDDLGAEKLSEWAETKLERVLSYRLDFNLPVFASTNLTEAGLVDKFNSRTLSRLTGLCEFLSLKGADRRPSLLRQRVKDGGINAGE